DEEEKMDVYYLENDKLFLVLQEVKRMIEHERKLYKKHELDFADYFDLMYECETKRFWEFLMQVALNAKFDWEKYTVTVKIEVGIKKKIVIELKKMINAKYCRRIINY